ncbi:MAG: phosphotransferase [Naasia sp.]|uniref:maltokinase N-terminal cap-like domain-containing protein n=1 Tax=Naasia sp. TaxID=2546198 RepID=UPI002618F4A4|nr:phosphotransferase [Naasia sp.]MCU1571354.1 phosphotransferase [Naasia sp.]
MTSDSSRLSSPGGSLHPDLATWIAEQRWFSGKGGTPELAQVGRWRPDGAAGVEVLLVHDRRGGALYQVPLVTRPAVPGREPILTVQDGAVYDGPHDEAFAAALLTLVSAGGYAGGTGASAEGEPAGGPPLTYRSSQVLRGEQSNTSIIVRTADDTGADAEPVMIKLFRVLHPGDNPDVVLQTAIAAAGSDRVPRSIGSLRGSWGDGATGHLAFAQEFLPGTEDAWRVATRAVDAGEDFAARARALGQATAEVHRVLASALPTAEPDAARVSALLASMRSRLQAALEVVPSLAERAPAMDAVFAEAAAEPWPLLQRVHGDYHLGQVLLVPDRGWVLLDFEGEPLRPMAERSQPDLAFRDVAGMLRSFDYAAGASREGDPGVQHARATEEWAASAREGFLSGYQEGIGASLDAHRRLLAALELDKALYEAVYEARNRPDWLPIPTAAIERLVSLGA